MFTCKRLSEYVCKFWLRSDGRVEKMGYRQPDKGTLQRYIVDCHSTVSFQITANCLRLDSS